MGEEDDKTPVPSLRAEKSKGVDVDWDDEDEATTVFDRGVEDAARSLLHSAPASVPPPPLPAAGVPAIPKPPAPLPAAGVPALSKPPPPPAPLPSRPPVPAALVSRPPMSVPPPAAPRAPLPPPPKTQPAASAAALEPSVTSMNMPYPQRRKSPAMLLGAVAVVVLAGAAAFALMPKKGSLVVTVSGPGNKAVDKVEILVDGEQKCAKSPCQITDLPVGTHLVKVVAAGYQPTADQAIKIVRGEEAVHNVALARKSDGTGVRVAADGAGLKLVVDGKDVGPLPQELKDLTPGEHTIRIDGSDRYEPFEKRVTIEADRMLSLEPKLKVIKGLATIKPGDNAEDARVLLVSGNERRPLPSLPIKVDISVDKPYSIVATKKGFEDYEEKIEFEDGQAERTFVVSLSSTASGATAAPTPAAPAPAPAPAPATGGGSLASKLAGGGDSAPSSPPPAKAAATTGTLNISSNPSCNVILDGKPLGATPKTVANVSPGSHTVIFVHPEHGRKAKTVNVEAGKTASAAVKF